MYKKMLLVDILFIFLFTQCMSETGMPLIDAPPTLENVLTLELSFGDEKTIDKDEFLIANSRHIQVNDSGDIYVYDEDRIKVYDNGGQPKNIIGRPGIGPGEFGNITSNFFISPSGYLFVQERIGYNLFSPENEFIEKRQFNSINHYIQLKNKYKTDISRSSKIYALNEKEYIITAHNQNSANYNDEGDYDHFLFYKSEDELKLLTSYKKVNSVTIRQGDSWASQSLNVLGDFYCAILPSNRIVYTHSGLESEIRNGKSFLKFHVISKDGSGKRSFEWIYAPEKIEDSYIDDFEIGISLDNLKPKAAENRIKNMLRKKKYKTPFSNILSDGSTLFLVKNLREGDSSYYIVNVIDTESGAHLSSFRTDLSISNIKNGYLYREGKSEEGFYVIEKYKIDQAVYGKYH